MTFDHHKSANFAFLSKYDERLVRLGNCAERYFSDDPPSALIKLRQLGEFLAKEIAARHGLLPQASISFDDVLRVLKMRSFLPREVADLFYHLKQVGNAAAHDDEGTASDALTALKIARAAAVWFYRSYGGETTFAPGPFIPPTPPSDATRALLEELSRLKKAVADSSDAAAKAQLQVQEAEAARLREAGKAGDLEVERSFWERYAAETEVALRQAEQALIKTQTQAKALPARQLTKLANQGAEQARRIDLDEQTTRVLIDEQLRAVGWSVDTKNLRYAKGARPEAGKAMAIAEWPTTGGPVDYALFIDGRCVGVVEAKRSYTDVPGRLGQTKRYAIDIILAENELPGGGPWIDGSTIFRVPYVFVTNGRPYVEQLKTKSGIWFWDARAFGIPPRALMDWFSPRDLQERLERSLTNATADAAREIGIPGLRPYQVEAISAIENAMAAGQRNLLIAMATGTGKTRLAIALMYELLRTERCRRILFLVDRNALGEQAQDAMRTTDTNGFLKFNEVFPVAELDRKFPEAIDRVQVATIQAMIRRVFDDPGGQRPTPGTYDLIIVDEAHRGYTLDAELREEDLEFRNLDDYLSAYRRVLEYFDATKIALTATPALHTREIFGPPVYRYGYRQAVIDGYLMDHRPPVKITTALSQAGISFLIDESVRVVNPKTNAIDLIDLPDQVDFEVADFNKKVYTQAFNRIVAEEIARRCPPKDAGKTLLFAVRDDHADTLVDVLRAALTEEYGPQPHDLVEKITGSVDRPQARIKAFKNDPRPKYVVTVDLLTTGIDVPEITNLVFVRRINSRILYEQMIGRATRPCGEIGKEYFRIFDAVDIYAKLQDVTDMIPVAVRPDLSFATLLADLDRATTAEDKFFVRDQIVVKLRLRLRHIGTEQRENLELVLGPLDALPARLKGGSPEEVLAFFDQYPSFAHTLDSPVLAQKSDGIFISEHEDRLVSVDDDFGSNTSPVDYIESFEAFIRSNLNEVPALIAATQKPRELTRSQLKEIALLLDGHGFSEANLRQAYGRARNADIAAHIIGFVRQAALGDPLVPYQKRVENGVERVLGSRDWTSGQRRWLERIGRALKEQPVGDPVMLAEPLFAQAGGFEVIDREFDHGLGLVLSDLNAAIWDNRAA